MLERRAISRVHRIASESRAACSASAATLIGKIVADQDAIILTILIAFSHPQTGECLKSGAKFEATTTIKSNATDTSVAADSFVKNPLTTTEHNPYSNYSGEYGKEFNHYVKMGVNESDVQQSIDKIVDIESKHGNDELGRPQYIDDIDGYILVDVSGNEITDHSEALKHPQYVTDRHAVHHHEESIAMVTVGCLILGMLVFLIAMVYIRRVTRRVPSTTDIEAEFQCPEKPHKLELSKIVHKPLPSMKWSLSQGLLNMGGQD